MIPVFRRFTKTLVLTAVVLLLRGCASDPSRGYSKQSLYPQNIATVHIPIFENATFDRDVEFELTDAVIKEIESRTPYKVASSSHADTILTGRIRTVTRDSLSRSRLTGLSEEVIVSVTIDFQWRDLRSGNLLVARESFSGHGLFVPSRPSSEPIALGKFAAVQQLARDVVDEMQSDW